MEAVVRPNFVINGTFSERDRESYLVGTYVWEGYLTTASTFLAQFLMKNKVKTTMPIGEQL